MLTGISLLAGYFESFATKNQHVQHFAPTFGLAVRTLNREVKSGALPKPANRDIKVRDDYISILWSTQI